MEVTCAYVHEKASGRVVIRAILIGGPTVAAGLILRDHMSLALLALHEHAGTC